VALELTSAQILQGYCQYRVCIQALFLKKEKNLIEDPDALFKGFCILQLRFIHVFIRASEDWLGKNRQNKYK